MSTTNPMRSAAIAFDTLFAYQKSAALKTAIDLDLLTAIRGSPPMAAGFSLTTFAEAASGDAFTLTELREQLEDAGFKDVEAHGPPTSQTVLENSRKRLRSGGNRGL
jgi:hypothetical protein